MENVQAPARVACVQMEVVQGDKKSNLDAARRLILEACEKGANLLILPELINTGSMITDRAEAYALAESIPDGASVTLLLELAQTHGVYVVASLLERKGADLFNTAVLVGPDGLVGKYRKLHPCEDEVYWVEPGDLGLPVFH